MERSHLQGAVSKFLLSSGYLLATKCLPGAAEWTPYMRLSAELGFLVSSKGA